MNEENRKLMDDLIKIKLSNAIADEGGDKDSFKEAMDAIKTQINMYQIDESYNEHIDKMENEKNKLDIEREKIELEREKSINDNKKTWIRWGVELGTTAIIAPIIGMGIKRIFMRDVLKFEENHILPPTFSGAIKDFFRFK